MYTPAIKVKRADVAVLVAATFPDYKGRKFSVRAASELTISDLNWSGGTRSQYRACTLSGEKLGGMGRYNAMAPWNNPAEGMRLPIAPGAVVVRHSMFCGKDVGLEFTLHPEDMPKLLTA